MICFANTHLRVLPDTSFHKARSGCSWLSLDSVAYCIWGTHNRSSWFLSQFLEQCVCKNPACVASASLLFGSRVEAVQRGHGSSWTHHLQYKPSPSAQFQPVLVNCGHIHFSLCGPPSVYTVCFKLGIRIFRKTLGKFQVYYRALNS